MMVGVARAGLAALLLFVTGCATTQPDQPTPPPGDDVPSWLDEYAYSGASCFELGLQIPVPASGLRPHVPDEYTLVGEDHGQAVFALAIAKCDEATVPGTNTTVSFLQSDMAVLVEEAGGERPWSSYQVWMPVTNLTMASDLARVGMPAMHSPLSSMTTFSLAGVQTVEARIVAHDVSFSATGTGSRESAPTTVSNTYWHSSQNATTRLDYEVDVLTIGPANGALEITGETLAAALGGSRVEGGGIIATFNLAAEAERTAT